MKSGRRRISEILRPDKSGLRMTRGRVQDPPLRINVSNVVAGFIPALSFGF